MMMTHAPTHTESQRSQAICLLFACLLAGINLPLSTASETSDKWSELTCSSSCVSVVVFRPEIVTTAPAWLGATVRVTRFAPVAASSTV